MSNIVTIGYVTEGKTDARFLQNIIHRTFQEISFDCSGEIEVFEPEIIEIDGCSFVEEVVNASKQASEKGLLILCIHSDSDDICDETTFNRKIEPAIRAIGDSPGNNLCKNLVAIVPVQMTESWMLADRTILKDEIGTDKTDNELGINREPEAISDPKAIINKAIQIAFSERTRRQRIRQLTISELYQPLGQKIALSKLDGIQSYSKFKKAVREAFCKLNYLN